MNIALLAMIYSIALFAGILLMIETGRRIGVRRHRAEGELAAKGFGAVEGAIFGLLGLILAFSFSGGLSRFDMRRQLVVKEANDIGTAWLRIDLLPPETQGPMRDLFRRYLEARLEVYRRVPDMDAVRVAMARSSGAQKEIWAMALPSAGQAGPGLPQMLLLPALNAMFDTATSQHEMARMHPPRIVFVLLGALVLACSLFAGYDMGGRPRLNLLHSVAFALVLSVTVYVIIDIEYPRIGFIRMTDSDALLMQLRESMN